STCRWADPGRTTGEGHRPRPAIASRYPSQGAPVTTATRVVPLVLGRKTITSASALLVLSAFFACTTLFLTVAAGAWMFFQTPPSPDPDLQGMDAMYKFLASFATILLIIPASTLASASATLSARRQDERLSTMSLLGAR